MQPRLLLPCSPAPLPNKLNPSSSYLFLFSVLPSLFHSFLIVLFFSSFLFPSWYYLLLSATQSSWNPTISSFPIGYPSRFLSYFTYLHIFLFPNISYFLTFTCYSPFLYILSFFFLMDFYIHSVGKISERDVKEGKGSNKRGIFPCF